MTLSLEIAPAGEPGALWSLLVFLAFPRVGLFPLWPSLSPRVRRPCVGREEEVSRGGVDRAAFEIIGFV